MKIISICNQKGGCGKTTTTVNLGAALVQEGKKVLIIDNDYQANLTVSVGITPNNVSLFNCFKEELELKDAIATIPTLENLDIIPSNLDYSNADHALIDINNNKMLLKDLLDKSNLKYDYILIDCSPSLTTTVINALVASDSILIPLEPSLFNLQGIGYLVKIINLIKSNFNPKLEIEGILLTRVDARSSIVNEFKEQLNNIFPNKLFKTEINLNTAINRSQSCGLPVMLYDLKSKGSIQYTNLAKEILKNGKKRY